MEQQPILSAVHQEEDKDDDFGSINREQSSSALTFETVRVIRSSTLYNGWNSSTSCNSPFSILLISHTISFH